MRVGVSGIHAAGMSEVAYGMGRRQSSKAGQGKAGRQGRRQKCRLRENVAPSAGSRWDAREG